MKKNKVKVIKEEKRYLSQITQYLIVPPEMLVNIWELERELLIKELEKITKKN